MHERDGVEVEWANEALGDPDALRIDADPSSKSGEAFAPSATPPRPGFSSRSSPSPRVALLME